MAMEHEPILVGWLTKSDTASDSKSTTYEINIEHRILIGRDTKRCEIHLDDPRVSNWHLLVYTVFPDPELAPLVYARDLSRNGSEWNSLPITKNHGPILLCDGDTIRVSKDVTFTFHECQNPITMVKAFSPVQIKEQQLFSHRYKVTDRRLGCGGFGAIHLAYNMQTQRQLVCKVIDVNKLRAASYQQSSINNASNGRNARSKNGLGGTLDPKGLLEKTIATQMREVDILKSLNHPNIISIEKVFVTDNTIYIFEELITAGDLFYYVEHHGGRLHSMDAMIIVYQILLALEYLRDKGIVHRDVKPENVLMTSLVSGGRVVLTDFGAARCLDGGGTSSTLMFSQVGTSGYTAPEVKEAQGYTKAVDLWSLGALTVVLLTGQSIIPDIDSKRNEGDDMSIVETDQSLEDLEDPLAISFIKQLLVKNEHERMTAKQALQHPWISNEFYCEELQAVYKKAIKDWVPRRKVWKCVEYLNIDSSGPKQTHSDRDAPTHVSTTHSADKASPYFTTSVSNADTLGSQRHMRLSTIPEETDGSAMEENTCAFTSSLPSSISAAVRTGEVHGHDDPIDTLRIENLSVAADVAKADVDMDTDSDTQDRDAKSSCRCIPDSVDGDSDIALPDPVFEDSPPPLSLSQAPDSPMNQKRLTTSERIRQETETSCSLKRGCSSATQDSPIFPHSATSQTNVSAKCFGRESRYPQRRRGNGDVTTESEKGHAPSKKRQKIYRVK
ncbi:kinase-like protein [Xylona heveae TC161]|uniref:Kinase-like protein n=1 Tax=Xylona heveae (strain CBS 132557 / TC161) TaxID=1328760 RepID=A0A164ZHS6_XYLHT|nr:kinase-like protein [Xylona heveae TC161]KZF19118.1 kinase-like protein [Xylona heveae TC161]